MSSELVNMDEFKEYRPLGSKRKSAKHYLVFLGFSVFLDEIFISRYSDIKHLVEIENKWTRENR